MWEKNKISHGFSFLFLLSRKVTLLLFSLSLFSAFPLHSEAQIFNRKLRDRKQKNLGDYDRQLFHFGFSLGVNSTNFVVKRNPDSLRTDSVFTVEPFPQPGFNLGIISDMRMGRFFNLRFIPTFSFADRFLQYTLIDTTGDTITSDQKVESTFLQFPLCIKFKSIRPNDGNWRAYILAGGSVSWDLASQAKIQQSANEIILKLKKFDYSYEVGLGFDFYLRYFKFSSEIKMSFGLNNQLVKDKTIYTQTISSLNTKTFLLSLHFE